MVNFGTKNIYNGNNIHLTFIFPRISQYYFLIGWNMCIFVCHRIMALYTLLVL